METAYLSGSTPGITATTGGATVPRRGEGNVALGLFSKIAAARKENLSTFSKAAAGDLTPPGRRIEKRSMDMGTNHFPELSDPSIVQLARNPNLRTPVMNERKANAPGYSQNLRWAKQSVPEGQIGAVGCPATVNSPIFSAPGSNRAVSAHAQRSGMVAPTSRRRHILPPHQQMFPQRRCTVDSPTEFLKGDREVLMKEQSARPATASEILDTRYTDNVRGYVRRPPEALSNSLDPSTSTQGWHRHGELPHSLPAGVVDNRTRGDGRVDTYKPQTDPSVANGMKHPGAAPNQEVRSK